MRSKPAAGLHQLCVEIATPVDLDLERVHAVGGPRVAFDDVTAGEWIVEAGFEPEPLRDRRSRRALIHASAVRPRQSPNTIGGIPSGGGGIEWQSSSRAQPKRSISKASWASIAS